MQFRSFIQPLTVLTSLMALVSTTPVPIPPDEGQVLPGAQVPVPNCNVGGPTCRGDATEFTPGVGFCGKRSSSSDLVFALPRQIMGSQSTNNPLCGQRAAINFNRGGPTVTGTLVDECLSCAGAEDLDLSPALFDALGGGNGSPRISGMTWQWV